MSAFCRGLTPLKFAVMYNENPAVAQVLIDSGVDPRKGRNNGALSFAVMYNENPAVAQLLIDAGADPNGRGGPFHDPYLALAAAYNENPEVVQVLIDAGAEVNKKGLFGFTALHDAARMNENPAAAQFLIDAGADVFSKRRGGNTPLDDALEENENPEVAQVLRDAMARAESGKPVTTKRGHGSGGLGALVAGVTVAAVGAASGLDTEQALEAGAAAAESVLTGQAPAPSAGGGTIPSGSGRATSGSCLIPGYPRPPGGAANFGFPWCPASVSIQVRAFALQAAGAQCAIATGSSSTSEQIQARQREIEVACGRLAALGNSNCRCPPGLRP